MKLRRLQVSNLLSFDEFELGFDDHLTLLVGPNGAGKTNVIRAIDLASTSLAWADERWNRSATEQMASAVLAAWAAARLRHRGVVQPASVRLDLELTAERERDQVRTFVRAAVLATLTLDTQRSLDKPQVASWLMHAFDEQVLAPLWRGTLILQHSGVPDTDWELHYEFDTDVGPFSWTLVAPHSQQGITRAGPGSRRSQSQHSERLLDRLWGVTGGGHDDKTLPDPLPAMALATLLPEETGRIVELPMRVEGGEFDLHLEPYRRFSELLAVPPQRMAPPRSYSFARVLHLIMDDSLVFVGEQLRGLGTGGGAARPAGVYSWSELSSPLPQREPSALPLRLFALKNGDQTARDRLAAVQRGFRLLAHGRTFEIAFSAVGAPTMAVAQARASALAPSPAGLPAAPGGMPAPDETPNGPEGTVAISVVLTHDGSGAAHTAVADLPITLAGAGVWEALVLAEALTDTVDRVVVLDEPALNLHPSWQRQLREWMRNGSGQMVVATHSGELVPMGNRADLNRLVRFDTESGASRVHHVPRGLDNVTMARIARELRLSADARALLFARAVVLLEGETELGALPAWLEAAAREAGLPGPAQLDIAFHSVGGGTNFEPLLVLLDRLGIPWVLLCDGAAFDLMGQAAAHIFQQVLNAGIAEPQLDAYLKPRRRAMTDRLFHQAARLGREHGVLTFARGWTPAKGAPQPGREESFDEFVQRVAPGKWQEGRAAVGSSKARIGIWLGEEVGCPAAVASMYPVLLAGLRRRGLDR